MAFKNRFIFFLLCLFLSLNVSAQELKEQFLFDGRLKISIPAEFSLMSEEMRNIKYPNYNPPTEVYTNEATTVNLALKALPVHSKTLIQLKEDFEKGFSNLNPEVKIITINGIEALKVSFVSKAIDTDIYNRMVIIPLLDGKTYAMFNFNMTKKEFPQWGNVCEEIIQSVLLVP